MACTGGASPWAASVDEVACARLESLLGSYSEEVCREWLPSDHFVGIVASSDVSDQPDVWTDGSFVLYELSGVGVGRCGVYSLNIFDGDLLIVIERMTQQRSVRSVKISEVEGHADDDMVAVGRVRVEDIVGNDLADRAADFARRRVSDLVIAIARAAVNEDGCAGLLCILLFGLVVVWLEDGRFVSLLGRMPGFRFLLASKGMALLGGLVLRFVSLMLVFGRILLALG